MKINPISVGFKGQYMEVHRANLPDDILSRPKLIKPYLKQVANHLPKEDTLILSYNNEGLRVGIKSNKKFYSKSIMESDVSLKFTKPISIDKMRAKRTSEYVLRALPIIIGKEKFEEIDDKIFKETDCPTPYYEYLFFQESYPDEDK